MTQVLKAGKYLIGDPCYFYDRQHWSEFCDRININPHENYGSFIKDQNDNQFWYMSTANGDGAYPLYKNDIEIAELGVDSGLLAIIPLEIAQQWPNYENNKKFGHIIKIEKDCEIINRNGNAYFADYELISEDDDDVSDNDEWPEED